MQNKITISKVTQVDDKKLFHLASTCNPMIFFDQKACWLACNYYQEYTYIVYVNDQIAGYILATANDSTIIVHQIGVLPPFRHCGTAQILLDTIAHVAKDKKKGIHIIYNPTNTAIAGAIQKFCDNNDYDVSEIKITDPTRFDFRVYGIIGF